MSSLTFEELSVILRIVNDNETILEANCNWFTRAFPKTEHFRICCGLGLLINDSILVNKQRVVAAVLLCWAHRSDNEYMNPFLSILLETVQKYTTTTMEKSILSKLLRNPKYYIEIVKKTINQVFVEFSAKEADELDTNEIQTLRDRYEEFCPSMSVMKTLGIPGVISVANHPTASVEDILSGSVMDSRDELYGQWTEEELLEEARTLEALYGSASTNNNFLKPSFVQFCPGLMEISNDELYWIDLPEPAALVNVQLDLSLGSVSEKSSTRENHAQSSASSNNNNNTSNHVATPVPPSAASTIDKDEMLSLLRQASSAALSGGQRTQLINWLKAGAVSVKTLSLSQDNMPGMIENNWTVAAQCLVRAVPLEPDLLRAMEEGVLTFHSIEVFSQLHAADLDLPVDFIQRYLSKCMQTCENTKDKSTQNRFLRLVCTLLQSLVRKNNYNIKGLFPEMQTFCTTFAKTKEANALFGMIKAIENSST